MSMQPSGPGDWDSSHFTTKHSKTDYCNRYNDDKFHYSTKAVKGTAVNEKDILLQCLLSSVGGRGRGMVSESETTFYRHG